MDFNTTRRSYLDELRKRSFNLKNLPDEINLGVFSNDHYHKSVPLSKATVDHLAFAQQVLNSKLTELLNTFDSIRNLHDLARSLGANGCDYALDYIREYEGEK